MWKIFKIGCGTIILFFVIGISMLYYAGHKKYDYHDFSYRHDYSWENIEVGTIARLPKGSPVPNGRYRAVIAFKKNQKDDARILLEGPKGELPGRIEFISGEKGKIIYRIEKENHNIDLSLWENYPKRTDSSSTSIAD